MQYFFSHNGYEVKDRLEIADKELDHENIWGVVDENLFTFALREIDKAKTSCAPLFSHII